MATLRSWIATVGIAMILLMGTAAIRACVDGRAALKRGDARMEQGDAEGALRLWRQAARWYLPLAGHVDDAYARMEGLAEKSQKAQEPSMELKVLRGIRSSIWATRGLSSPHADRLDVVNHRIADIMAAMEDPSLDPARDEAQRSEWHYQLLAADPAPDLTFTLLAAVGFFVWVGSLFCFANMGIGEDDRLKPKVATLCALLFVTGLIVWLAGLRAA